MNKKPPFTLPLNPRLVEVTKALSRPHVATAIIVQHRASEARRIERLEAENAKLRKQLDEAERLKQSMIKSARARHNPDIITSREVDGTRAFAERTTTIEQPTAVRLLGPSLLIVASVALLAFAAIVAIYI